MWPVLFLLAALCFILSACAFTQPTPDGHGLVTVGNDIIPGILPADGAVRDVIGGVVDAARNIDPSSLVTQVADRDWLGLGVAILGFLGAVVGGVALRRRIRARKVVA